MNFAPNEGVCGLQSAVTLGTFDGVHVGHKQIIERVLIRSQQSGVESVVVTFDRHPANVLHHVDFPGRLTTLDEKLEIFRETGVDRVCVIHFTEKTAQITADEFIREYLSNCLGMRHFVVGFDHGFGKGRSVSTEKLRQYARTLDFSLEIIEPVTLNGMVVKSSIIRSLLLNGDVDAASFLLGREYSISGKVVRGKGIGKMLGIPTANLNPDDPEKIIPKTGVYAGWIKVNGVPRQSVISIGPRPTFDIAEEAIEIHIPDFSEDIYGASARIGFVHRLRDIVKFDSSAELVEQIHRDIEASSKFKQPYSTRKGVKRSNGYH